MPAEIQSIKVAREQECNFDLVLLVTYIGISHLQLEQASSSILDMAALPCLDLAELTAERGKRGAIDYSSCAVLDEGSGYNFLQKFA